MSFAGLLNSCKRFNFMSRELKHFHRKNMEYSTSRSGTFSNSLGQAVDEASP